MQSVLLATVQNATLGSHLQQKREEKEEEKKEKKKEKK